MTRVIGPNGLSVDVADAVASGLVSAGHATYTTAMQASAPPDETCTTAQPQTTPTAGPAKTPRKRRTPKEV